MLVPVVGVILFMALYPQLALHRSEASVKTAVASAHDDATTPSLSQAIAAAQRLIPPAQSVTVTSGQLGASQMSVALLATAHLKGPHIDFAALSPLIALLGGATIVLLVGLIAHALDSRARSCPR